MSPTPQPLARADGQPASAPDWSDPQRQARFSSWLAALASAHQLQPQTLTLASADASFRRYFRIDSGAGSRIIMDAPPDQEDCGAFVKVAALMQHAGLRVPQVLAWDEPNGFLLLSDLGTQTLMQVMDTSDARANQAYYLQAVDALIAWQRASRADVLPVYDQALLRRELDLFSHWYLQQHRGFHPDATQRATLEQAFSLIMTDNLRWPQVYVHRDFMPRNLMVSTAPDHAQGLGVLGVLDFQDAVYGPITYDIASLMRDAFLSWDEDFVLDITARYWQKARSAGLPVGGDFGEFYRAVEWMGLQRHLKVAGIFARLSLRDGKPRYLADTPRFIGYILATAGRYRELRPLLRLVEQAEQITPQSGYAFGRV